MPLPEWTEAGLLPPGVHSGSLPDVYERCVAQAPDRTKRELIYGVLVAYIGLVKRYVPHGRAWVGGDLVTTFLHGSPYMYVTWFPVDWEAFELEAAVYFNEIVQLITVTDLIIGGPSPTRIERAYPMSGMVAGFFCPDTEEWRQTWTRDLSQVPDGHLTPGATRGFVEVTW